MRTVADSGLPSRKYEDRAGLYKPLPGAARIKVLLSFLFFHTFHFY